MRIVVPAITAILTISWATCAWALYGTARVECSGSEHVVTASGIYLEMFDGDIAGVVFQRESLGTCVVNDFIPASPLPVEPFYDPEIGEVIYEASVATTPPIDGVAYKYTPFAVTVDGEVVPTFRSCGVDERTYAFGTCGAVPYARGVFELAGTTPGGAHQFSITVDDADCWIGPGVLYVDEESVNSMLDGPWSALLGFCVDVFGDRTYCSLPGGEAFIITDLEPAPGGACGPVPQESTSWGALKAMYR